MQVGSPEDLDRLLSGGKVALDLIREQGKYFTPRELENACKGVANGVARDLAAWITVHRMREPPRAGRPPTSTEAGGAPGGAWGPMLRKLMTDSEFMAQFPGGISSVEMFDALLTRGTNVAASATVIDVADYMRQWEVG